MRVTWQTNRDREEATVVLAGFFTVHLRAWADRWEVVSADKRRLTGECTSVAHGRAEALRVLRDAVRTAAANVDAARGAEG